jgi:hypothetical protein
MTGRRARSENASAGIARSLPIDVDDTSDNWRKRCRPFVKSRSPARPAGSAITSSNCSPGAATRSFISRPIPVRILRAAQFHELVGQMVDWGRNGDVSYVREMRSQLIAARTVAEALVDLATASERTLANTTIPEIAGPREESMVDAARQLAAARRDNVRVEGVTDPADRDDDLYVSGALLPSPRATLAGPTFEEWLQQHAQHPEMTSDPSSAQSTG